MIMIKITTIMTKYYWTIIIILISIRIRIRIRIIIIRIRVKITLIIIIIIIIIIMQIIIIRLRSLHAPCSNSMDSSASCDHRFHIQVASWSLCDQIPQAIFATVRVHLHQITHHLVSNPLPFYASFHGILVGKMTRSVVGMFGFAGRPDNPWNSKPMYMNHRVFYSFTHSHWITLTKSSISLSLTHPLLLSLSHSPTHHSLMQLYTSIHPSFLPSIHSTPVFSSLMHTTWCFAWQVLENSGSLQCSCPSWLPRVLVPETHWCPRLDDDFELLVHLEYRLAYTSQVEGIKSTSVRCERHMRVVSEFESKEVREVLIAASILAGVDRESGTECFASVPLLSWATWAH